MHLASPGLLIGIEALRAEIGVILGGAVPLTLTSGYRNPVHHTHHTGASSRESQHQYGAAVDIRISDQGMPREEFFEIVRIASQRWNVSGCFEPERVIRAASSTGTLTHAHVDWRLPCPDTWRLP